MAKTAQELIRELSRRLGNELILSTATGVGLVTTVLDSGLRQYLPVDVDNLNFWVYCLDGTAANKGLERRAKSWAEGSETLTLYLPGFPSATAIGDTFEIHKRTQRVRKLEAINAAVRELSLGWMRPVVDVSLTTVSQQYRYTLPAIPWARIRKVQVQYNTTQDTYPYIDMYDWEIEESVSASGVRALTIQFGGSVPADRIIRITGEAYYDDAVADLDVVPLAGRWAGTALEWIYNWATGKLLEWEGIAEPAGYAGRYDAKGMAKLEESKADLIRNMQVLGSGKIGLPGRGTASARGGHDFLDVLRIEP